MELQISIELDGKEVPVGTIVGKDASDTQFSYLETYTTNSGSIPVSYSRPFQMEAFSPERTRNYFEGLLPEG